MDVTTSTITFYRSQVGEEEGDREEEEEKKEEEEEGGGEGEERTGVDGDEGKSGKEESEMGIGADQIILDQPDIIVELPSYAPEMAIEMVVGFTTQDAKTDTEKEALKGAACKLERAEAVLKEIEKESPIIPLEPAPGPLPTQSVDDVSERDIFGSSDEGIYIYRYM